MTDHVSQKTVEPSCCLTRGPDMPDGRSTICMLTEHHACPHEWSTFVMGSGYVAIVPAKGLQNGQ